MQYKALCFNLGKNYCELVGINRLMKTGYFPITMCFYNVRVFFFKVIHICKDKLGPVTKIHAGVLNSMMQKRMQTL